MEFTIRNEKLTVKISDKGAELQSIRDAFGTEYLWQGDPAVWEDKAPNLFPYIARMTDGMYTVYGKEYEMKIHGFVMYMTLQAENQTDSSITFRLDSNEETKVQYPFDFTFRITYVLEGSELKIFTTVENRDEKRMYFGLGGHPGFCVPLAEGLTFEDYYLEFSQQAVPTRIGFNEACFLNGRDELYQLEDGKRISLVHHLFDQDAIVLKHVPPAVKLGSEKDGRSVTVHFPDFGYLGFWHMPRMEAPYVCIEPWSSLPSRAGVVEDLEQQTDLIRLNAGEIYKNTWKIAIQSM